jgi:hypothetical protein
VTAKNDEWDFYYCRVDDAPASIFLNLAYREERPAGLDTLYYVGFQMLEPGEHGMGLEPDVKALWDLEDKITDAAAAKGFTYVGRLRNQGDWQLTFYAAGGDKEPELEEMVVKELGETDRGYRIGSKEDAEWSYFDEFLMPDGERWQWIMDRRVVEQLNKAGDALDVPRPVDHFIDFPDAPSREAFMNAARERGFSAEAGDPGDDGEPRYPAQLIRTDPVTLEHIHDVVMDIIELAEEHGGDYDGWGAPIASKAN